MALSLEDGNLAWQRVKIALDALGANTGVRESFRALKAHLSQLGNNPTLQFVAISNLTADVPAADAACKLYGVFLKKQATSTAAYYKAFNDAATDSSAEDALLVIGLTASGEQAAFIEPSGKAFSAGITHGSFTAATGAAGTTATTTGDGPNGFILIGAA